VATHYDARAFDPSRRRNSRSWKVHVIWDHVLRDQVPQLTFASRDEAVAWIAIYSRAWFANELATMRDDQRFRSFVEQAPAPCHTQQPYADGASGEVFASFAQP
jgi:hypothetical protein